MKISRNYTGLRDREKRIYSISGTKISSAGVSVSFLKVFLASTIFVNLFGVLICIIGGKNYYSLFNDKGAFAPQFILVFLGISFGFAYILVYTKVQNYRLMDFLLGYFMPKKTITAQKKNVKLSDYKQDALIERL